MKWMMHEKTKKIETLQLCSSLIEKLKLKVSDMWKRIKVVNDCVIWLGELIPIAYNVKTSFGAIQFEVILTYWPTKWLKPRFTKYKIHHQYADDGLNSEIKLNGIRNSSYCQANNSQKPGNSHCASQTFLSD